MCAFSSCWYGVGFTSHLGHISPLWGRVETMCWMHRVRPPLGMYVALPALPCACVLSSHLTCPEHRTATELVSLSVDSNCFKTELEFGVGGLRRMENILCSSWCVPVHLSGFPSLPPVWMRWSFSWFLCMCLNSIAKEPAVVFKASLSLWQRRW